MTAHILLVEDNVDLALGLHNNLEIEGYGVRTVHSGEEALDCLDMRPDLVILDLMLPGTSGMKVLQEIRSQGLSCPVLVLTARGEEADKVRALRLGADDYVTKPFGLLELLARVEALLRRSARSRLEAPSPSTSYQLERLVVRPAQRDVRRDGLPIELTPKEFDLLLALLEAKGAVVSRAELLAKVWGYQDNVYTRTVDTHVAELRRKIEPEPRNPRYVLTARKAGYRIANASA